jgi:hypothetical protein
MSRLLSCNLDMSGLDAAYAGLGDNRNPTAMEKRGLWRAAVESLNEAIADGADAVLVKRDLAAWLFEKVPALSQSIPAIVRSLERKYARWKAGINFDNRETANKARSTPALSKEDRDVLIGRAMFNHDGELDPAWVDCIRLKKFSREIIEAYPLPKRRRGRCPRAIREQVSAEKAQMMPWHRGPRHARLNGAHIERDWSNVFAGDRHSSDDKTLDVYFSNPDVPATESLTRGQFLPMIDERSKKILDFCLVPDKSYNAFAIRSLIRRVCNRFGLPHRGWRFENGIWKSSRLLGNNRKGFSLTAIKENFASRLGLDIQHPKPGNARAKVVENVLGLLGRLMRGEPGYVGRDEAGEKMERVQRAILDVQAGRLTPAQAGFYTLDEWMVRLHAVCEEYNNKQQESRVIGGNRIEYLSPEEAYEKYQRRDTSGSLVPPVFLPPEQEYMLGEHMDNAMVKVNGVRFQLGKEPFGYNSPELQRHLGEAVRYSFDPDAPSQIVVSDLKGSKFLAVPRSGQLDAEAERDALRTECRKLEQFSAYARARYSELRSKFVPKRRPVLVDPEALEVGRKRADAKKNLASERARSVAAETDKEKAELAHRRARADEFFERNALDFV